MINRFSQYLSRGHGNFSNIVPSIPSDNGISILPADKRSISLGPIGPDHCSRDHSIVLIPKKDVLSERCTVYGPRRSKGKDKRIFPTRLRARDGSSNEGKLIDRRISMQIRVSTMVIDLCFCFDVTFFLRKRK